MGKILYLNTVSAGVIGASLMLLGVYNYSSQFEQHCGYLESRCISAYFASDITEQERLDVRTEILSFPEVTKVVYISEEEAQEWLIERVEV